MLLSIQRLLLLLTFFYLPCSLAAKIQVIGTGEALSEPDHVTLSLNIEAQCYPTVAEANEAVDAIAEDLLPKLNALFTKKDNLNQISTHGGYTQSYYPPTQRDTPSPCQDTFQKITRINIQSTELNNFEKIFNQIQKLVYTSYPSKNERMPSKPNFFVTMSQPAPSLSFKKTKILETEALQAALENAREKANSLVGKKLTLIEITEGIAQAQPMPMLRMASADFSVSGSSAPIAFEQNRLEKQITATFEY